jgi:L-alanine-DL-glutamate epimerase-like enolase superfamily enzyme
MTLHTYGQDSHKQVCFSINCFSDGVERHTPWPQPARGRRRKEKGLVAMNPKGTNVSRRELLRHTAIAASGPLFQVPAGSISAQAQSRAINRNSAPADLKITDIRGLTIASNYDYPIIRIDTDQGVYGLGELFCLDMISQALLLKPFLVGKNPLQIEAILAEIRQFATQGPTSGAYSAVDIALHDIAGKVYGVPVWRLLGNKLRDKALLYCDTTGIPDAQRYGRRMAQRKKQGFQFFKMDLYTSMVENKPGAVDARGVATDKGLKYLCEIIAGVREGIGWDPLAADHFGRLTVNDAIRYARAFEPYQLAWAEDLISARDWRGFKKITESTTTPTLTGEMLFGLEEGWKDLIDNQAVDMIHPDVTNGGGLLHMANSAVGQVASVHLAATLTNFLVLEYHAVDIPGWQDVVTGVEKPIFGTDGYQHVPDTPGLGLELNEAVVKEHLRNPSYAVPGGYFEPTVMYDKPLIGRHALGPYPHFDADGNFVNDLDEHTGTPHAR